MLVIKKFGNRKFKYAVCTILTHTHPHKHIYTTFRVAKVLVNSIKCSKALERKIKLSHHWEDPVYYIYISIYTHSHTHIHKHLVNVYMGL